MLDNMEKSDSKKIARCIYIVNARIPNTYAHGIQITETAAAMSPLCRDFLLVTPAYFGAPKTSIETRFKHVRLPALDIPFMGKLRFYIRMFSFLISLYCFLLLQFFFTLSKKQPIVLYARGEIIFALLPFKLCFPIFFETHQIRNHNRLYRLILRRLTGLIVITDRLKRELTANFLVPERNIVVARDGVDFERFSDSIYIESDLLPNGKKIVMYSGSLSSEKGVDTLAQCADLLPSEIQVVFIGGADFQIKPFKKKYNQKSNITVVGRLPHNDIPAFLQRADVLILPDLASDRFSNLFTSPMKLFEYMASGKPIIASDIPSLREVLNEQSASFFKAGDTMNLSNVIISTIKNYSEATQKAANAKKMVLKYTWPERSKIIANFVNVRITSIT